MSFLAADDSLDHVPPAHMPRISALDGWRAVSILAVLQCHLGPYDRPGTVGSYVTEGAGFFGMALFFCLSGYLITNVLYRNSSIRVFVTRRFFRIVPAAWLFLLLVLPFQVPHLSKHTWLASFLFFINEPPFYMVDSNAHMWSLAVEVQFYLAIAILFAVLRRKTFLLLPLVGVAITLARVKFHYDHNVRTEFRVDEILSGVTLAYLLHGRPARITRLILSRTPPIFPFLLLIAGSTTIPSLTTFAYLRPYSAALLIGSTIWQPSGVWSRALANTAFSYLANVSYALYLWHPIIQLSLHPDSSALFRYLCAPPFGLMLLLLIAHVSTLYFERPFIQLGNRIALLFTPAE